MNNAALVKTIRNRAQEIIDSSDGRGPTIKATQDDAELLKVLARVIEGRSLDDAFGAPGGWGYGTPIGDAVAGRDVVINGQKVVASPSLFH